MFRPVVIWTVLFVVAVLSVFSTIRWKTDQAPALNDQEARVALQCMAVERILGQAQKQGKGLYWVLTRMYQDTQVPHDKTPLYFLLGGWALKTGYVKPTTLYRLNLPAQILCLLFIYLIGAHLFSRPAGLFAAIFWAFFPINIGFARMSLMEYLLTAWTLIVSYLALLLVERRTFPASAAIGLLIASGFYLKQFFILFPFGIILYSSFVDMFETSSVNKSSGKVLKEALRGKALVLWVTGLTLFIVIRGLMNEDVVLYILQAMNVVLTAIILVVLFFLIRQWLRRGSVLSWQILYVLFFGMYTLFPLAGTPRVFGDRLMAFDGFWRNLLCDQVIYFHAVTIFFFFVWTRSESIAAKGTQSGIHSMVGWLHPSHHTVKLKRTIANMVAVVVFMGLGILPWYLSFGRIGELDASIGQRGIFMFGFPLLLFAHALILTLTYHFALMFYAMYRLNWGWKELLCATWFLFPIFAFTFLLNNAEHKYFLPAMPALAVLVGKGFDAVVGARRRTYSIIALFTVSLIGFGYTTFPGLFDRFPARVLIYPQEHHRVLGALERVSDIEEPTRLSRRLIQRIGQEQTSRESLVLLHQSVENTSWIAAPYLNLLRNEMIGYKKDIFVRSDTPVPYAQLPLYEYLLIRESSPELGDFLVRIQSDGSFEEIDRFSIDVNFYYALYLSISDGLGFSPSERQESVYILYQRGRPRYLSSQD